ncbi:MAG TPA: deoxyribonuclease IV, partial [Candidatus Acidoferrales bacterium]|nr:deoxyribonuclease IV [Candidatus Acidoferrales bacterium]
MEEPQHSPEIAYDVADEYRPEPPAALPPPFWKDGSKRVGIHTSIAGDIVESLERARRLGCNALQIFSSSPRMWPRGGGNRIPEADAARFRAQRERLQLGPLVVHTNYLINLASPDRVMRVRSVHALRDELLRAVALGADFLVVHPGSSRAGAPAQTIEEVARGMRQAARGIKLGELRILLENTSGMGMMLGWRFEQLKAILDAVPELATGICLDTAHAFQAGYELRTENGLERTLEAIERTVRLGRV